MKKIKSYYIVLLMLILSIALLSSGCSINTKTTSANIPNQSENKTIIFSESESLIQYNTINDLTSHADDIIIGTIVSTEEYNTTGNKYLVNVESAIKGEQPPTIDVYEDKGTFEVGKKYLLFLEHWESSLYANSTYTSIDKESIFELENEKLKGNEKMLKGFADKDSVISHIKNSKEINDKKEKSYKVIQKAKDYKELLEQSDYVLHIVPTKVGDANKYVASVDVQVVEHLKGNMNTEFGLLLPVDMEIGKDYIVFMRKRTEATVEPTARIGSIVSKSDVKNWDTVMKMFEK